MPELIPNPVHITARFWGLSCFQILAENLVWEMSDCGVQTCPWCAFGKRTKVPATQQLKQKEGSPLGYVPYPGVLPSIVIEDLVPTCIPPGSVRDIIDLVVNHQPLVVLLIVSLNLLPAVRFEAFSGHITFLICLLLYRDLGFPVCSWFPTCLMLLL